MDILDLTAVELGRQIRSGQVSAVEAVRAALLQIEAAEPSCHAFIQIDREGALKQAEEVQRRIEDGTLTGPLAGVPVAVKDNLCIKKQRTTCASKMLADFRPSYTAAAVECLVQAGAWEAPRKPRPLARREIHGIRTVFPAAPPGDRVRQLRPICAFMPWGRIRAVRFGSPVLSVA